MKIATWNVNGIRARQGELLAWLAAERPSVVCLQEIKASLDQLTFELRDVEGYWAFWHGQKGYSGVGMLISKALAVIEPSIAHPAFDFEQRIATVDVLSGEESLTVATVYVPNGGKDYEAKLRFLDALDVWAGDAQREGRRIVICGDLNVAREERDVHPKERKPNQIGTRPAEREVLERLISRNLVDVGRALDPDNENLFTWWAPWRNLRQRNIGWRIDYVLASAPLAARATASVVMREVGTSDHGPVVVTFGT
ncbi:MAG TPA: exodeoxyribonuclease III [Vicinamibacterales bacterium]|nr:exodeoxyribonuclease III [Vicinamibacterales bacterium]